MSGLINSSYHQTADSIIDLAAERERESSTDALCKRLQRPEVCKTVRAGGRGSTDRHSWDIIIERGADGIYTQSTPAFFRGPLKDVSRTLKAEQHDAGVVIYGDKL